LLAVMCYIVAVAGAQRMLCESKPLEQKA